MVLWRRGFFGKGDLSRSEPSWLARQLNLRKSAGKCVYISHLSALGLNGTYPSSLYPVTSEEVTARRRAERRQFKLDRARAIAAVAEEAEELFEKEGTVVVPALSGPAIPSAATWKPSQPVIPEVSTPTTPAEEGADEQEEDWEERPIVNVEHMQLTLQETWFLIWNLDCLTVLHPDTVCQSVGSFGLPLPTSLAPPYVTNRHLDFISAGISTP